MVTAMPLPTKDLTGQRFGYLLVLERIPKPSHRKRGGSWFRCRCDCGLERVYSVDELTTGTRSKCERHRAGPPGSSGAHAIFCQYRHNAKTRGIGFALSKDEFLSLTSRDCHYCGSAPRSPSRCGGNSTPETLAKSLYLYNGIDRVNNSLGYAMENCVPCCKQCNRAKTDMTVEDFLTWIARVHARAAEVTRDRRDDAVRNGMGQGFE